MARRDRRIGVFHRGAFWLPTAAAFLTACAGGPGPAHPTIKTNLQPAGDRTAFRYCGGWGCTDPREIGFTDAEWQNIAAFFSVPAVEPAAERRQVAQAIARMEDYAGARTGYDRDRGGTVANLFAGGQLDCYSEAANTSNYLHMLARQGLLRHHTVAEPAMRGLAGRSFGMTHATAVLEERETGARWAIDTWFHDNGVPPEVVALTTWAEGYTPEDGASW